MRDRLLRRWWRAYSAFLRDQSSLSDYPPVAETYLSSMLSRRLNLPTPLVQRLRPGPSQVGGASDARVADRCRGTADGHAHEQLSRPGPGHAAGQRCRCPIPPAWRQLTFEHAPEDVTIEPMAMRVPHECFYVRFGQYSNYIWLNALLEDYGGDIRSMISSRGVRTG